VQQLRDWLREAADAFPRPQGAAANAAANTAAGPSQRRERVRGNAVGTRVSRRKSAQVGRALRSQ